MLIGSITLNLILFSYMMFRLLREWKWEHHIRKQMLLQKRKKKEQFQNETVPDAYFNDYHQTKEDNLC
jgi:hypothetical protein